MIVPSSKYTYPPLVAVAWSVIRKELAAIAQIDDLTVLTLEIFQAKSNLNQLSCDELVKNDYKIFNFAGQKVMISQLETVSQNQFLDDKKACLLEAMAKIKIAMTVDLIFVIVSDILNVNSKILILEEKERKIAETAFDTQSQNQIIDIGNKLSRKKEIAPAIELVIQNIK